MDEFLIRPIPMKAQKAKNPLSLDGRGWGEGDETNETVSYKPPPLDPHPLEEGKGV
jgi:hypothetical protein